MKSTSSRPHMLLSVICCLVAALACGLDFDDDFDSGVGGVSGEGDACESFADTTSYFGDGQLDAYCLDAGYWEACGEPEMQQVDCDNLEKMVDCCWDGGGDCPYCSGA